MLNVYSDKLWLPANTNHTVLLYPFWGEIPVPPGEPDTNRFKNFVLNAHTIVNLVNEPNNADVFVLPFEYRSDALSLNLANTAAQFAKSYGKKLILFFNSDSPEPIQIENAIVFRTSFYKSERRKNEYAFPGWSVDFTEAYSNGFFPIKKESVPSVCYCGYVNNKRRSLKQTLKNILIKPKSKSYEYGAYVRGKAVERLIRNNKIKCDFIIRDDFWASQSKGLKETREEYAKNMLNSPYALVTRGAGNFSYRFYEVFSCGRIPVFINTDSVLPFEEFINWKEHMVWVNDTDINNIGEILLEFHNKISPEAFLELQIKNRKLYEDWLSPLGYFSHLKEYIK
ncbi:MAG: exostosin family protein [Bacteroidetes bacterium]|nr:exostosin family protein [Bacteroidota bacterium]